MIARPSCTPRVGVTIAWQALSGERVRGSVWSAGPHAGTVWAVPATTETDCTDRWPEAHTGGYDPACCRFPKSCSPRSPVLVSTRGGLFREVGRA